SAVILGLAAVLGAHRLERRVAWGFSYDDAQEPAWLDVQRWARDHTGRADAFIVPPLLDGEFRVESERTVYADVEDGGLMNGNPTYGIEWLRRMQRLGMD